MGQEEVDTEITVQIGNNVEYLNQEFEGRVKFELNRLVMDPNHAYIPDLHEDHLTQNRERIENLILPVEEDGGINIFLFETYVKDENRGAMLGFTPVLTALYEGYEVSAPRFDRLFLSYPGLSDMSTIVHEMGHFLGLSHPWEMSKTDLDLMGFYGPEAERNHMTYHPEVNNFSDEQLARMQHFAMHFRKYLLNRVDRTYKFSDPSLVTTSATKTYH